MKRFWTWFATIVLIMFFLFPFVFKAWAGEKEDLIAKQELIQWKYRAVKAESETALKTLTDEYQVNQKKLDEINQSEVKKKAEEKKNEPIKAK